MRKSLLTLALIAGSITAINAQNTKFSASKVTEPAQAWQKMNTETRQIATIPSTMNNTGRFFIGQNNRAAEQEEESVVTAVYGFPVGSLFYGLSDESYSFSNIVMITGAFEDVTFNNYSNDGEKYITDVEWSWPSGSPLSGTQKVDERGNLTAQAFGSLKFPVLTAGTSKYGETFTSTDGSVSAFWNAGLDRMGVADFAMSQTEVKELRTSISNACVQYGFYGGFGNGHEFTSNATFYAGSGNSWTDTGQNLVGFAELYDKPLGFVYAEDVTAWFWADGIDTSSPLGGKTLTATICTFGENGLVPYATATATDEDVTLIGTNGICLMSFKFKEEDPIFGDVAAPIALPEEDFIVLLTGFEDLTGKFTGIFAAANGDAGHAYAILANGKLATAAYSNSSDPRVNLHIGFHAAVPVAELASPESGIAVVPDEGGYAVTNTVDGKNYNDVDIYTMSSSDKWIIEKPDWIDEVELDDDYVSKGILIAYIKGQPLPEGVDGRSDKVVFTLYGKKVEVTVTQGNTTTAISNVENNEAKSNGAIYNISGQKVDKDYKGIVIQDGRKFIQK